MFVVHPKKLDVFSVARVDKSCGWKKVAAGGSKGLLRVKIVTVCDPCTSIVRPVSAVSDLCDAAGGGVNGEGGRHL